jgi:hypothetical protein
MKIKSFFIILLIFISAVAIPLNVSAYTYEYKEDDVIIDYLPGDVKIDGLINASDARLCLRAAAQLEELTDVQKKAADLDGTGVINSSNARKILRASAKIEPVTVTVNLKIGQRIVVGPLNAPTGREWLYRLNKPNKFDTVTTEYYGPDHKTGTAPYKIVCLTPAETGTFYAYFEQQMGWNKEIFKEFDVIINVD